MTSNRALAILCAVAAIDMVGYGAVLPLLPFLAVTLDASPLEVTAIIAAFPLAQLVAAPVLGALSDRSSRRLLIVLGLLAAGASYLLFALSSHLLLLLLSRLVAGSAGATYAVAQALVADVTEPQDRATGMGWLGAAYGVGLVVGPSLGSIMVQWGFVVPGLAAAAICLGNAVAAFLLLPAGRSPTVDPGARSRWRWRRLVTQPPLSGLFVLYALCITAFESIMAVLALYLARMAHLQAGQAGLLWALAGLTTIGVRAGLVGRLSARWGESRTIQGGVIVLIATMLGLQFARSIGAAALAVCALSAGAGLVFPSLASVTSKIAPAADRGLVLGANQTLGGLGKVLGPIGAGALMTLAWSEAPLLAAATVLGVALLVSQPVLKRAASELQSSS